MDRDKVVKVIASLLKIRGRLMDEKIDEEEAVSKALKMLERVNQS